MRCINRNRLNCLCCDCRTDPTSSSHELLQRGKEYCKNGLSLAPLALHRLRLRRPLPGGHPQGHGAHPLHRLPPQAHHGQGLHFLLLLHLIPCSQVLMRVHPLLVKLWDKDANNQIDLRGWPWKCRRRWVSRCCRLGDCVWGDGGLLANSPQSPSARRHARLALGPLLRPSASLHATHRSTSLVDGLGRGRAAGLRGAGGGDRGRPGGPALGRRRLRLPRPLPRPGCQWADRRPGFPIFRLLIPQEGILTYSDGGPGGGAGQGPIPQASLHREDGEMKEDVQFDKRTKDEKQGRLSVMPPKELAQDPALESHPSTNPVYHPSSLTGMVEVVRDSE